MIQTKIHLLSTLLLIPNLYAFNAEEIKKIASEPHNRDNLIEELKLYPEAREYKLTARSGISAVELMAGPEITVTEKTVQGRYIVSQATLPGADNPLIMIVTFQEKTGTFKKWVLLPDGMIGSSTGLADQEKRTIAWVSDKKAGDPPGISLSIESHSDDMSTWKETTVQDGKIVAMGDGVARKTK